MFTASLDGLLTGLSLIVAIGAQNAFVLRQGLRKEHVGPVVTICTLSDYALILAGVGGVGAVVRHAAWALEAVRWFGAAFLIGYGLSAAWRARRPAALTTDGNGHGGNGRGDGDGDGLGNGGRGGAALPRTIGRTLALTWLNPHVYLDTVILLGSIANTHGPGGRWWFAAGVCVASTLWFTGLGYGARFAARPLSTPRAWQVLDLLIAATMLAIAVSLVA